MITFAKRGDLHARRQVLRFVKSKLAMENLFGEIAERYKERPGGYCRVIKLAKRRLGDASEMALVQLVGSENDALSALKKPKSRKAAKSQPAPSILEEVSTQVNEPKAEAETEKTA
jgi:large subunit ribosomal protein L17